MISGAPFDVAGQPAKISAARVNAWATVG